MAVQIAVIMANLWRLLWKPYVKTMDYEKSPPMKVSNCFWSYFKDIFRLVVSELKKSFRFKVSDSFSNRVRSTIRVWQSFHLLCVLLSCPLPIGGANCRILFRSRRDFASKISNVGLKRAIPQLSAWDSWSESATSQKALMKSVNLTYAW
jgi:hypothetical protein